MTIKVGPGSEWIREFVPGEVFFWGPYPDEKTWWEIRATEDGFRIYACATGVELTKPPYPMGPRRAQMLITGCWANGFLGLLRELPAGAGA